jgi:hypothetical protein
MMHEGPMKGHMMMCPLCAAIAAGMTRVRIATAPDGGVVVSANGRLLKYDGQLNLVKQIDLPLDVEQMHRRMLEMMDSPLHERMREKMREMMAHHGGEEGGQEPLGPPGRHHHGRGA